MNPVLPGSAFSLLIEQRNRFAKRRIRVTFVVERVSGQRAHGTVLETNEPYAVDVRALARGMRGARPVGQKPRTPKLSNLDGPAERRPPREVKPHGLQPANAKYAEALAMQRAGKSNKEIAAHYGEPTGTISNWLTKARDAERDERNRRAM